MADKASPRARPTNPGVTQSRRTLLKAAAAGTAAVGIFGAGRAVGASANATAGRGSLAGASSPVVAYVSDARSGELVVMVGTNEVVRRDAGLVARLIAIAKEVA